MWMQLLFALALLLLGAQLPWLSRCNEAGIGWRRMRGERVVDPPRLDRVYLLLRASWIASSAAEAWLLDRSLAPLAPVWLCAALLAQLLRVRGVLDLGPRWTLHGERTSARGRLQALLEVPAVPLLHGAVATAAVFLVLEGAELLLRARLRPAAEREESPGAELRIAIIGAGPAGLAAARALQRCSLAFEVLEQSEGVGGLWAGGPDSPLAKNTHAISPKQVQAFSDAPMPEDYPDFPHHSQLHAYLQDFARRSGLLPHVRFGARVERLAKHEFGWRIHFADGSARDYRCAIIASGHHRQPDFPRLPGEFAGEILHSRQYSGPERLCDKRVLVVGAGQSAVDVLGDAAVAAAAVYHSTRRGFVSLPRYVLGRPLEQLQDASSLLGRLVLSRLPLRWLLGGLEALALLGLQPRAARRKRWGLPPLERRAGAILPTMDQRIYDHYAQGDIRHKPALRRLLAAGAEFADGTREALDAIVFATGYRPDYPFVERALLNWPEGDRFPVLYEKIFHPTDPSLFAVGMVQPFGSHWPVFEAQAELLATYLRTRECGAAGRFDARRAEPGATARGESGLYGDLAAGLHVSKPRYLGALRHETAALAAAWLRASRGAARDAVAGGAHGTPGRSTQREAETGAISLPNIIRDIAPEVARE